MNHNWQPIIEEIRKRKRILLTTHVNPDGDGLGSEMALYRCLKKMGICSLILNDSPTPDEYKFLDPEGIILCYSPEKHGGILRTIDLVCTLDIGGFSRLGKLGDDLSQLNLATICIDHHPENHLCCTHKIVDEESPATACLIYELIKIMCPQSIDKDIAEAVYVGLLTDTGSFRFDNTSAEVMEITAELIRLGVKPMDVYRQVYESYTPQRMKLLGVVLQKVQYECDGKLAWFTITTTNRLATGVTLDEINGFTDFIRSIKGVEVAVMFLETDNETIRVNFRSKGKVLVNKIASQFSGGGHYFAAGATIKGSLDTALGSVLPVARKSVDSLIQGEKV
jgi:phosphoesterase RecJ-like protein